MSKFKIFNEDCHNLEKQEKCAYDALITDPPYGIGFQNHEWDKALPEAKIWIESLRVLKPGGFGLVFSSIKLMHRLMVDLEDSGFLIKDVLFWSFLNGMPKSRDVALEIDKELGVESEVIGHYKYVQGYKKGGAPDYYSNKGKPRYAPSSVLGQNYKGSGLALKPAYEPIILIQKPIEQDLSIAQNVIKNGSGLLNIEATRIPYEYGEGKVGHHPHPKGRVPSNILRLVEYKDGYDKFFLVPKVRQKKDEFNTHPTIKPVELMHHLVKLVTFEGAKVLDPFMGSGSTGVACLKLKREFHGYEIDNNYFKISARRLEKEQSIINKN